jgi:hypothetical protein
MKSLIEKPSKPKQTLSLILKKEEIKALVHWTTIFFERSDVKL